MQRVVEVGPRYASETLILRGEFRGKLSPYDIPEQARSEYDVPGRRFRVWFEYLTPDEPRKSVRLMASGGGAIVVQLGKHSNKLYSVEITGVNHDQIPRVRLEIVEAIKDIASKLPQHDPRNYMPATNLGLAKAVLERESDLFAVSAS